jgi:hypothetical protein
MQLVDGGQLAMGLTVSHWIVGLVGIGYLVTGIQQYTKGNVGPAIMWIGYAFSQIGLWMGLAR